MKTLLCISLVAGTVFGQTFTAGPLVQVSMTNLFADCAFVPPGFVPNSEVEPWLAVNPANHDNLIGIWQQDRFSDGGVRAGG